MSATSTHYSKLSDAVFVTFFSETINLERHLGTSNQRVKHIENEARLRAQRNSLKNRCI